MSHKFQWLFSKEPLLKGRTQEAVAVLPSITDIYTNYVARLSRELRDEYAEFLTGSGVENKQTGILFLRIKNI